MVDGIRFGAGSMRLLDHRNHAGFRVDVVHPAPPPIARHVNPTDPPEGLDELAVRTAGVEQRVEIGIGQQTGCGESGDQTVGVPAPLGVVQVPLKEHQPRLVHRDRLQVVQDNLGVTVGGESHSMVRPSSSARAISALKASIIASSTFSLGRICHRPW